MRSLKTSLLSILIALSFTASLVKAAGESTSGVTSNEADAKDISASQQKVEGLGYTAEAKSLKQFTSNILQLALAAEEVQTGSVLKIGAIKELDNAASYYSNLHGTCVDSQAFASWWCREKTSPHFQKTLNDINIVAGMISGVAIKDACSNFAKISRLTQLGLTAYTASCSSARAACEASCATVKANLDRIVKVFEADGKDLSVCTPSMRDKGASCSAFTQAVNSGLGIAQATAKKDSAITGTGGDGESAEASKSIATKNTACTYTYMNMILSAGTGIYSMIKSFKESQQCGDDTNGDGGTPTAALPKCDDPTTRANDIECICKDKGRTPGCNNSYQKANDGTASRLASQGGELGTANGAGTSTLPGIESDPLAGLRDLASTNSGGGDSSGIGAPTGGGSGLSGFGGGSGGAGAQGEAAKKGLNTDTLSGSGGGGGGGGGFGGFKGSDPKLRQYLPGGAKDPSQGMAGQQAWKNEVTGQGGKSNWEKIKERYRDNKNTLLNN